MDIIIWL